MALSWNEIKERAVHFSKEYADTTNEDAEAKPFLIDFFNVFGISRKKVATFEERVKKLDDKDGYIDLLWKGTLLVEMKSKGKNLDKAYKQAKEYLQTAKQIDLPKYIIVSDFENLRLYDLEEGMRTDFLLKDFVKNVQHFGFIAGYQKKTFKEQDPVNIHAAELMGKLHDKLKSVGYTGHSLEMYLVRLLFCLFADDTTIFERDAFRDFVEATNEDGSDLAARLTELFFILNTPKDKRLKNLDEVFSAFPYVNGKLFEEALPLASFNSEMRRNLIECCALNWGKISPAIFGSMFQSVMNPQERRNLGAHYTSEKNILKLIKPLFLDELWIEFEKVKDNKKQLTNFHDKISLLRFLDPACGCGNFLVISYRELRKLEIEIIKALQKGQQVTDISHLIKINVDRFYGIEYEEFPAQIAQVAMWLMDHQMNMEISEAFGEYYIRLPLQKSAVIVHANALQTEWQSLIDPLPWEKGGQTFDYIMGNPPFIGYHLRNQEQSKDMALIYSGVDAAKELDYVTCWYIKAAQYLKKHNQSQNIKCAFVSTNSISQGEQVGVLWTELLYKYQIVIHFAHRTFQWNNEASGNAAVHVVIIGFSNYHINEKRLYEYENLRSEPHEIKAKNINGYLVDAQDIVIRSRNNPLKKVSKIVYGNKPTDGGFFILSDEEKAEFLKKEPKSNKYIKPFISAHEYLNGKTRWCLWLKDITPDEINKLPMIKARIDGVRKSRLASSKLATRKLANFPTIFEFTSQPESNYILIPRHSSENRKYVPFGFFSKNEIAADSCSLVPNANVFEFGIISSLMHNVWLKTVGGRIKSDYRYSGLIVYNNFPWPENPTEKQKKIIEEKAKQILVIRSQFPKSSLADLYDPITMPPPLVKAHNELDKAVDLCYRPQSFTSEAKRIEFLFELYEKYTAGLFAEVKKPKKKVKSA